MGHDNGLKLELGYQLRRLHTKCTPADAETKWTRYGRIYASYICNMHV